ncbi:hypothetical protein ABBQ32_011235 [Trebouxia sp. C0010 RCD-2024]
MVTLRSEGKPAAAMKQPVATQPRTRLRSATPDRASQDSGLRRSQRVRDRHGALESIQEDTAASTGVESRKDAEARGGLAELAEQSAEAVPAPAVCRAQAVQQAILQASASDTSSTSCNSADIADSSDTDASDSETSDDSLAKLSQEMVTALQSESGSQSAAHRATQTGTAERNGLRASQPDVLQTGHHPATQEEDEEEEMHWQPLTGLPEPLTAQSCRSLVPATRPAQLEKQFKLAPRDTRSLDRQAAKAAPATAGKQWFDLPAQQMTDETKRDLKLLRLRGTFDPKRFYKSSDHKKGLPKFFQVGTVVESSADFYSGRLSKKDRKQTITEELLADPELSQARKRRFDKLQDDKAYWARKKGRKTDLPRGKQTSRNKKR